MFEFHIKATNKAHTHILLFILIQATITLKLAQKANPYPRAKHISHLEIKQLKKFAD
jgi:hypothetical protein